MNKKEVNILKGIKEFLTIKLKDEEPKEEIKLEEEVKLDEHNPEQMVMADGTVLEAESFAAGEAVFIVMEDGNVPLPVGEYELDEILIVVAEEGIIAEIKEAVAVEESKEGEEEMGNEFVTVEDFNTAINEIKSLLSKTTDLSKEVKDLEEKEVKLESDNKELQEKLDNIPDAKAVVSAPIKKDVQMASTPRGRIIQTLNNVLN